jgi:hypothetical protein
MRLSQVEATCTLNRRTAVCTEFAADYGTASPKWNRAGRHGDDYRPASVAPGGPRAGDKPRWGIVRPFNAGRGSGTVVG